jgi:hypothetical protein
MKRNDSIVVLGLCVVLLLLAAHVFADDKITVTGTVYALAWDDNDNVIEALISGEGGEYMIVNNAIGRKLFKMAGAYVEASGVVNKDSEGNRTITVVDYQATTE